MMILLAHSWLKKPIMGPLSYQSLMSCISTSPNICKYRGQVSAIFCLWLFDWSNLLLDLLFLPIDPLKNYLYCYVSHFVSLKIENQHFQKEINCYRTIQYFREVNYSMSTTMSLCLRIGYKFPQMDRMQRLCKVLAPWKITTIMISL